MTRGHVAEMTLAAARRVLENVEAGRIYDPLTVAWARQMVKANTPVPVKVPSRKAP